MLAGGLTGLRFQCRFSELILVQEGVKVTHAEYKYIDVVVKVELPSKLV